MSNISKTANGQRNAEDCPCCPHYRGERRGCKLKKCTGGRDRRGKKPRERRRERALVTPWRG